MSKTLAFVRESLIAIGLFVFMFQPAYVLDANQIGGQGIQSDVTMLLNRLAATVEKRKAESIRNSTVGHQAPLLTTKTWLNRKEKITIWPPKKFTMLYFWSLDCGFCIADMNSTLETAKDVALKGGDFISIHAFTDKIPELTQVINKNYIEFPVVIDSPDETKCFWLSKTFKAYGVDTLPMFVSIGSDGSILKYQIGKAIKWQRLLEKEPVQIGINPIREVRPLTIIPEGWFIENVEPNSTISQNFLIYQPDTPELRIHTLMSTDARLSMDYLKYSEKDQTVYKLFCNTTVSLWSQVIEGSIHLDLVYENKINKVDIPFKISSKPLLVFSSNVYLGIAKKDEEIIKKIIIRSNVPREKLEIKENSVPNNLVVQLPQSFGTGTGKIPILLKFQSSEVGTFKEEINLQAIYDKGLSEQQIKIEYTAIVHE